MEVRLEVLELELAIQNYRFKTFEFLLVAALAHLKLTSVGGSKSLLGKTSELGQLGKLGPKRYSAIYYTDSVY